MTSLPARTSDADNRVDMADLAAWPTERRITAVVHDPGGVETAWDDGLRRRFPALWLRDNCPCPACRHPYARERRFLLVDNGEEPVVADAGLNAGGHLDVQFAEGGVTHAGRYDAGWLRHHARREPGDPALIRRRLWGAELGAALPCVDYDDVMTGDAGLARWLRAMLEYGIVLMRGAPARPGEITRIAARIQAHPHPTNFGVMYDVVSQPNPNASADTPMALEPHTDLANWRRPPDFQLLFCVANEAAGGSSVLVDGCRVAEELRAVDPDSFRLLATHPVEFRFHDADCDIRHRGLTIETGPDGNVVAVRFNNWLRTAFDLPEEFIEPMYCALRRFWLLLREPRFQLTVKLDAGQMLALDNLQIMHGREAFDPNTGRRHLQGLYVDRDMVMSRLRVLARDRRAGEGLQGDRS